MIAMMLVFLFISLFGLLVFALFCKGLNEHLRRRAK